MTPSMSPGSWPLSFSACCTAFTCSELPPIAAPPLCAEFMSDADDLVSDFIVPDDVEVEPLADGDDVLPLVEPLADGELPLLSVLVLVPAAPLDEPALLPALLGPCASAGAAANAKATASADAPVSV